jgi:glycosyltransferase involved in cell wall biosynthesis
VSAVAPARAAVAPETQAAGLDRVARVITRLNIGGPSIQAIDLSRDLRAEGFETCLIHGALSPGEGDMTTILPITGADAVYVDHLVRPVSPLQDLRACWRIYRALCRWRPAVVHTHTAKAGAAGRLAALLYNQTVGRTHRARLIHTYHGHVFDGYFGSRSAQVFLAVERWFGRRTDAIVAISPRVRDDIIETYGITSADRVRLIPLGFNLGRFAAITAGDRAAARAEFGIPAEAVVVTTVGRLTAIKQHSLFLDMAARLHGRSTSFVFLIVGDGELRGELETAARDAGLAACVRFVGWRGDLERVYGATDVFVLTSRNEGTPVALIEAMASGVAPVSTDVGGVRDVITSPEVGRLVPFGDAEGLADAVRRLAEAPAIREAVGRAGRSAVIERFHLRRLVADISGLYRDLLAGRPVTPMPTDASGGP